jgi:hypothetical protein
MNEITEAFELFRRGPELARAAVAGLRKEEIDWIASPGTWSVRQIACHLADSEMAGAWRFRRVLAEPNPVVEWYDEKAWAENLDYARRTVESAIESFCRTRAENIALLEGLPEEAWARPGVHSKVGPLTLGGLLKTYAEHAAGHAQQIEKTRAARRV